MESSSAPQVFNSLVQNHVVNDILIFTDYGGNAFQPAHPLAAYHFVNDGFKANGVEWYIRGQGKRHAFVGRFNSRHIITAVNWKGNKAKHRKVVGRGAVRSWLRYLGI